MRQEITQFFTGRMLVLMLNRLKALNSQFYAALKKYADHINTKYAAEMVQNCLKPTTPSGSTGVRTHGWCHSVGNQTVEVTKPNRYGQ